MQCVIGRSLISAQFHNQFLRRNQEIDVEKVWIWALLASKIDLTNAKELSLPAITFRISVGRLLTKKPLQIKVKVYTLLFRSWKSSHMSWTSKDESFSIQKRNRNTNLKNLIINLSTYRNQHNLCNLFSESSYWNRKFKDLHNHHTVPSIEILNKQIIFEKNLEIQKKEIIKKLNISKRAIQVSFWKHIYIFLKFLKSRNKQKNL